MRILHTSDWHFGKFLEGYSRLEEQKLFVDELLEICTLKNVEMIIIAGDIFDTSNPPALAEKLFYYAIKKLSNNGKRPIVIIAGNHDNPERLTAAAPLGIENGIIMAGSVNTCVQEGNYGQFKVLNTKKGVFEIALNSGENAVIAVMPYPSEKRIDCFLGDIGDENEAQKTYSQKIGNVFDDICKDFRDDTINIAAGHFYIAGGMGTTSERPIELGGAYAVFPEHLPQKAQYIAMGHLHRPQTIGGTGKRGYYSGSPIQFARDEAIYSKSVNIVTLKAGEKADVEKYLLKNYKPIEEWTAESIENAIEMCEKRSNENCYVYLTINTLRVLEQGEIKKIKTAKSDIVEIIPQFESSQLQNESNIYSEKTAEEQFIELYKSIKKIEPSDEMIKLFLEILNEEENNIEASEA